MRLADFITSNTEPILAEWVAFAATCGPAAMTMDRVGLRDHAMEMLNNIAEDLRTPQSATEQKEKSKGNAQTLPGAIDTAAEVHGAGRAESGFTIGEMVSEYRALRASVLRLWTKAQGNLTSDDFEDMLRFNEAIDQALAESVTRYTMDLDHSREMFVAILGHDLRTPLHAIMTSVQLVQESGDLGEQNLTLLGGIHRSSTRMNQMVGDLLDFTISRLGSGVPVVRKSMDMAGVARRAVEEMQAAEPERLMHLETHGELVGEWDSERISQVLSNLLSNGVQYGSPSKPISVTVSGGTREVLLRVHSEGQVIPSSEIPQLFSPLKRLGRGDQSTGVSKNLGLGLYIAERIVTAHGGTIDVTSTTDEGTSFTVRLPR